MLKTIYFQYDTRKHSLIYNIVIVNIVVSLIYLIIVFTTALSFAPFLLVIIIELILLYLNRNVLMFEYKFTKYYENLIVQRKRGEDVDKLKNPLIKIKFHKRGLLISFYELGYFNNEEYERMGRAIERFAKLDFDNVYLDDNVTKLVYFSKRTSLDYNHVDNKPSIALDSRLEWMPTVSPNLFISSPTGGGKTTLVNYLVGQFGNKGYQTYYFDPKAEYISNSDFVHVEYSNTAILKQLRLLCEELDYRQSNKLKNHNQIFVLIEEMSALKATLTKDQLKEFDKYFQQILFKGRSLKITLIVVAQVVDSELFSSSGIREQFNIRINLGHITSTRSQMIFDCSKKDLPSTTTEVGSGYIFINGRIYSYTAPRLPKQGEPTAELLGSGTFAQRLKGAINR